MASGTHAQPQKSYRVLYEQWVTLAFCLLQNWGLGLSAALVLLLEAQYKQCVNKKKKEAHTILEALNHERGLLENGAWF